MTDASFDDALQSFEDFLRRKRLKMTGQRRQMVKAALGHRGHFTAEDLYRDLTRSGEAVSMATVYRGLRLLEEASIVAGHDFADGQRRYERALLREHHDHMVCIDCRAVIEFQNERIEQLQEQIAEESGFEIEDHTLTLFVSCNAWRDTGKCKRRDQREKRKGKAQK
ncbi:MAG: Fur family transcriptional regulator [Planctomycetota bacterium]|jgi:Fur family ferric uptake transcriptional regulator